MLIRNNDNFYIQTFWTDDEKNKLRELYSAGHGVSVISKILGRTKYSVTSEIRTLKLPKPVRVAGQFVGGFAPKAPPMPPRQLQKGPQPSAQPIPRGVRTLPLLPSELAELEKALLAEPLDHRNA